MLLDLIGALTLWSHVSDRIRVCEFLRDNVGRTLCISRLKIGISYRTIWGMNEQPSKPDHIKESTCGGRRRKTTCSKLAMHNSINSKPYLRILSCGVIIRQHSYLLLTALTYSHRIWYGVRWIYSKSFQTSEGWTTHNLPIHSFGTSSPWAEGRPCLLQTTVYHRLTLLLEEDMSPSRHAEAEKICMK